MAALGLETNIPQAQAILHKYDADHSGRLELAEFRQLAEQLTAFQADGRERYRPLTQRAPPPSHKAEAEAKAEAAGEAHAALDARAAKERAEADAARTAADRVFAFYDRDGSGNIDYTEVTPSGSLEPLAS